VASYDVAADISIPSWWPRIELELETAWVKNWHATADVLAPIAKQTAGSPPGIGHQHKGHLTIPLPLNRADLDGLTKFLTQRSLGASQEFTSIRFVEPTVVSACASEVTVLIYGANIWRSAEVYFGGINSKEVKVLPDMDGISASFPLAPLLDQRNSARSPFGYNEVALRVNTRNGNDWRPIKIVGVRNTQSDSEKTVANRNCEAPYSVTTPIVRQQSKEAPVIFELTPSKLLACVKPVFIVTGRYLLSLDKQPAAFYLGGRKGTSELIGSGQTLDSTQVLSVTFADLFNQAPNNQSMLLTAVNESGFVNVSIDVSSCPLGGLSRPAVGEGVSSCPRAGCGRSSTSRGSMRNDSLKDRAQP
jgi:hypothetical protein